MDKLSDCWTLTLLHWKYHMQINQWCTQQKIVGKHFMKCNGMAMGNQNNTIMSNIFCIKGEHQQANETWRVKCITKTMYINVQCYNINRQPKKNNMKNEKILFSMYI